MVAVKLLGIIVAFYFLVVLEAFGQNFYPARYGKRNEHESQAEKNVLEDKRLEKGDDQEALSERKIRFFISGGRFGKRGCSADNCFQGSKEVMSEGFSNRQDRSERIRIPIRKNQFMMGSRFGKRTESYGTAEPKGGENLNCIYTGISDYYRCLSKEELSNDSDLTDSNSINEFFQ